MLRGYLPDKEPRVTTSATAVASPPVPVVAVPTAGRSGGLAAFKQALAVRGGDGGISGGAN
eukprot:5765199-Heterocapsa_arctica.AAC.1